MHGRLPAFAETPDGCPSRLTSSPGIIVHLPCARVRHPGTAQIQIHLGLQLRKGQNNCDMKLQLVDAWTSCRASSARAALCVFESCAELACSVAVCPSLGLDVLCHPSCRVSGFLSLFTLYLYGCFCSDYSQELPDERRTACARSWTCPTSETLLGHSH